MKIEDIMLYFPRGLISSLAKSYRSDLDDKAKNKIIKEGMYHFVPDEKTAEAIVSSEHLRPAAGGMKYINSYGTPVACLFCGKPTIDNFAKNVTSYNIDKNPYINPQMVATAIKVNPTNKEELKNYKIRNLSDSAVLYEGYCVLPHEKITIQKMVPDLVRDDEDTPIIDENGEFTIAFREAKEDEYETGNKNQDYLQYIKEKATELGYSKNSDTVIGKINNYFTNILDQSRMEQDITKKSITENIADFGKKIVNKIKFFINNLGVEKLEEPTDYVIEQFKFKRKNPYQDKKFGEYVAEIQSKEGLKQVKLKDTLIDLKESKIGNFLADKYNKLNYVQNKSSIHGKKHSDRVILNSIIIAQKEGLLKEDSDNKIKDILITAAAYHDIGRIGDVGPHSARSAKKIKGINLQFADGKPYTQEEKKLLMAIVESHEGKTDKIEEMLVKYNITSLKDRDLARKLSTILRDADALDRVRLDIVTPTSTKVNLNPRFLKTNAAKTMLVASYELENLTNKNTMQTILGHLKNDEKQIDNPWKVEGLKGVQSTERCNISDNKQKTNQFSALDGHDDLEV